MKNILLASLTLTLIASCTMPSLQNQNPSVTMPKAETISKSDTMMKDDTMDAKMDHTMMSGSWTPEEMVAMEKEHMMMSGSMAKPMMEKDTMIKEESKMMKPTGYMNYDAIKVKEALANGQKVALFFAANWCPSCRVLDGAINANLSSIPQNTLIVKVDYDTSDAMKQKYGVTTQHTTVLIDKDMSLISKKL